jgi:hypothetical protein
MRDGVWIIEMYEKEKFKGCYYQLFATRARARATLQGHLRPEHKEIYYKIVKYVREVD